MKPFVEMTTEEKVASCDRMVNVLTHNDWSEIHLMFSDAANNFRQEMENAPDHEAFLVNRAKYQYIRDVILSLPDNIISMRDELSKEKETSTNEYED